MGNPYFIKPGGADWEPRHTVRDVLDLIELSVEQKHYGPWVLCFGLGWKPYLKQQYIPHQGWSCEYGNTLWSRLLCIETIQGICVSPRLEPLQVSLAELCTHCEY